MATSPRPNIVTKITVNIDRNITALREKIADWKQQGFTVALVPTMGNLHAGHMALVSQAQAQADKVVVSIFINPLQFGANEDLDRYPHTPQADADKLNAAGVDSIFMPHVEDIYPDGQGAALIQVPHLDQRLCGRSRPTHFTGVATVVATLFNIVTPDIAVFGCKDYQQLIIIRRMVRTLAFPITIVAGQTVREHDGLALSSRNRYLNAHERQSAPQLYKSLTTLARALQQGQRAFSDLKAQTIATLEQAGFCVDYVAICDADTLTEAEPDTPHLVVLAAAWLGKARLIDNIDVPPVRPTTL